MRSPSHGASSFQRSFPPSPYHIAAHTLGVGPLIPEQFRGLPEQFRDVLRRVFGEGMPHPLLQPGYHHAAAEGVNEKAVPDTLGDGVRAFWNPGFGDQRALPCLCNLLFGQGPNPFPGLQTGPLMGGCHAPHRGDQGRNPAQEWPASRWEWCGPGKTIAWRRSLPVAA